MSVQLARAVAFHAVETPNRWCIEVVADGVLVGHVDRSGDVYRYFEGVCNEVIWSFAERDLAELQSRIRATIVARPATSRRRAVHAGG